MRVLISVACGAAVLASIPLYRKFLYSNVVPNGVPLSDRRPSGLELAETVDATISMLTTIALGIFVVVGFAVTLLSARALRVALLEIFVGLLFIISQGFSVYSGFLARFEYASLMESSAADIEAVLTLIAAQAVFLHVSFSLSVTLSLLLMLRATEMR